MVSEQHWEALPSACGNLSQPHRTKECYDAIRTASNDSDQFNIYNIYDTCPRPVNIPYNISAPLPRSGYPRSPNALQTFLRTYGYERPQSTDTCSGSDLAQQWLNDTAVQKALHVTEANVTN